MSDNTGPVVVGVDGSPTSMLALERAIAEAKAHERELHVIHSNELTEAILHLPDDVTMSTSELAAPARDAVWEAVESVLEKTGHAHAPTLVDRTGRAGDVLSDYCAEHQAALLVVGSIGRNPVTAALIGSTAQRVVSRAPCDVLLVRSDQGTG